MLAGIIEHRKAVARIVYRERNVYPSPDPDNLEVDVSIFDGAQATEVLTDKIDHRRLACEAKAELWKHIHTDDVDNTSNEAIQVYEEWSHTE